MELRAITPDEMDAFYTTFFRTMGFGPPTDTYMERERKTVVLPRTIAAFDAGTIVGTAYSHAFEMTLPGGAQVPAAGVTAVSVIPTHRRRGVATDVMRRQLTQAFDAGEPLAVLLASEGRIYRRFGYGIATQVADISIDVRDARVEHRPPQGRVVMVDGETADKIFPGVHERMVKGRAGAISRPRHFWESVTADRDKKTVHVVHEDSSGQPDGYARYDVAADWKEGMPAHKLALHELVGTNDTASAELWSFILTLDLIREVNAMSRPTDEPVRWMLDEPRAVRTRTVRDMYWVRPLDVARVLSERRYAADIDISLEVRDPLLDLGGTFSLLGGTDGASCVRSNGSADLRLESAELGSLLFGGISATELARAGRIEELRPGAVARADLAFGWRPRPWGDQYF